MVYVIYKNNTQDIAPVCFTYDKGTARRIIRIIHQNYDEYWVCRETETYVDQKHISYCEDFLRQAGIVLQ